MQKTPTSVLLWRGTIALLVITAVTLATGIIVTGLASALFNQYHVVVNAPECDDGNTCTIDRRIGTGDAAHCERQPATQLHKCTSSCYNSDAKLHCDGDGTCVSDNVQTCKGQCVDDPDMTPPYLDVYNSGSPRCVPDLFPIQPYFLADTTFFEDRPLYPNNADLGMTCVAGVCTRTILQTMFQFYWGTGPYYLTEGAPYFSCMDILDTNGTGLDLSCVKATELKMDGQGIDLFLTEYLFENYDGPYVANSDFSGRLCIYSYQCARINTTTLAQASVFWSLSAASAGVSGAGRNLTGPRQRFAQALANANASRTSAPRQKRTDVVAPDAHLGAVERMAIRSNMPAFVEHVTKVYEEVAKRKKR